MASSIAYGAEYLYQKVTDFTNFADAKLQKYSPSRLIGVTVIVILAARVFSKYSQTKWGETRREQLGRLTLQIPLVKKEYEKDIQKQLVQFQKSCREKWAPFGNPITEIPEKGWSFTQLVQLIEKYSKATSTPLKNSHLSGTIYTVYPNTKTGEQNQLTIPNIEEKSLFSNDEEYYPYLSDKLENAFTLATNRSFSWNALHSTEFAVAGFIEYQVVRMVASMFGGKPNEVMGFVPSGGTESLLIAVRAYRNWGIKNLNHEPGEGVVIAGKSVHASILKAQLAYFVKVVLIETDEAGNINMKLLESTVKKYQNKVIAIIGSAPSYPTGVVDPIEEMAEMAKTNGCGMHVDCCLGGFVINHLRETKYLAIPGVTSLSADTHKNGGAPKGSSVLVTKQLGEQNLAYYSIYPIPQWSGGPYGTPRDPGSQSCVQPFNALLTLLGTGQDGYKKMAKAIQNRVSEIEKVINEFPGKLRLVAKPEVNVVAFQIDKAFGLQRGATYAFVQEMAKNKFILNALRNDMAHFCITLRFASDQNGVENFKEAVGKSLEAIQKLNTQLMKEGKKLPGEAGMYCALETALTPKRNELSIGELLKNYLLGKSGAEDMVRAHFLAQLDPHK